MSYELSMLVPSIRPNNLNKLYDSVEKSFSHSFEFIVVGPYGLPDELKNKDNIRFIEDYGPPMRAQQLALVNCSGRFLSYGADDGEFLPGALDIAYNTLKDLDKKNLVMGKYQEGERKNNHMEENDYYILNNHVQSNCFFIPENTWMLNVGLMPTEIIKELGGWDCASFHCCPCAYNDMSVRLQKYGVKYHIQDSLMFTCSHMPGLTGDHAPIHNIQTQRDQPMFYEIYNHPYFSKRLSIDINNWKKAPARWSARFGEVK